MDSSDPGSLSDALEEGFLDWFFTNVSTKLTASLPVATTGYFYVALCSARPTDAWATSELNSMSETGYARQAIRRNIAADGFKVVETIIGGRQIRNACTLTFGANAKGSAWTTVTHWALWPSISGGLYGAAYGPLLTPITVANGGYLYLRPGAIRISID